MVFVKCEECNKRLKKLVTCCKCGSPVCFSCRSYIDHSTYCPSCHPANADKQMIYDYFKDKYAEKARSAAPILIMTLAIVLILTGIVMADAQSLTTASLINHSCEWVNEGWTEKIHVYAPPECVYDAKNDSEVCSSEFIRDDYVSHDDYVLHCKQDLLINTKRVSYELQGYNCKETEGEIICDSCVDGNCDGICDVNGGETCCKVDENMITCKNSVVGWENKSGVLPVSKLEV